MAVLEDGRLLVAHHAGLAVSADRGETWTDAAAGLEDRGMSVVVPHPTCASRVFPASRVGGGPPPSEGHGTPLAKAATHPPPVDRRARTPPAPPLTPGPAAA